MKLIAITPVRNEAAFIGLTGRAALRWCDEVVFLNHASTDATAGILAAIQAENIGRVTVLHAEDAQWNEMTHRQLLLEAARARGATHIAIVDADELLTANVLDWTREQIKAMEPGRLLQIPMRNMHRSLDQYRSDRSAFGWAITTVGFADAQTLCWRDANGYQHHHREPYNAGAAYRYYPSQVDGGVMHLQFANWRRLRAKQSWYQCMETLRWPSKSCDEIAAMYSLSMDERGLELSAAKPEWWRGYDDIMHHLNLDLAPWHEAEIDAMFAEHGAARFGGLNLKYWPVVQ